LFERKVSARKFSSTQVDVFDETVESQVVSDYHAQQIAGLGVTPSEKRPTEMTLTA
jgi:SP family general alpha glucoside:H+ symporter-like MFS transporter